MDIAVNPASASSLAILFLSGLISAPILLAAGCVLTGFVLKRTGYRRDLHGDLGAGE